MGTTTAFATIGEAMDMARARAELPGRRDPGRVPAGPGAHRRDQHRYPGERAPGTSGAGQHGPQFVGEAARPPQLTLAQAPVEVARSGAAEAGCRLMRAGEGGELVDVRLPQFDLGEPDHRRGGQAVLDDFSARPPAAPWMGPFSYKPAPSGPADLTEYHHV
jgi:hypothetical protein